MMLLYNKYTDPTELYGYDRADMEIPAAFWNRYSHDPDELRKREQFIATSPRHSYLYASDVIGGRFHEGEAAIATSLKYSYLYARDVIGGRFHEGEAAIATSAKSSYWYARDVIRGRFHEGEAAINTIPYFSGVYYQWLRFHELMLSNL